MKIWLIDKWVRELISRDPDSGITLYILVTGLIALLLGSLIGFERQVKSKAAGLRTHALLAFACSFLMTLSIWAVGTFNIGPGGQTFSYDASRIASGVVAGIGFLCGGVIRKEKFSVQGLTTAASLFFCAALGMACGAGFVLEAFLCAIISLSFLTLWSKIVKALEKRRPGVEVTAAGGCEIIRIIRDFSEENGISLQRLHILEVTEEQVKARAAFHHNTTYPQLEYLCLQLRQKEGIREIRPLVKKKG